jgi:hypothetical protein
MFLNKEALAGLQELPRTPTAMLYAAPEIRERLVGRIREMEVIVYNILGATTDS